MHSYVYLASTYGQDTYNSSTYNGSAAAAGGTGETGGNLLVNTGFAIAVVVTLACLIALTAVIIKAWKRKPAAE